MDIDSYISGFVDGEGCFCVSFQPSHRNKLGREARPSFSVSQNAERAQLLFAIRERWGCGFIRPDRSDNTLKLEVRSLRNLVEKVLPHFRMHPLLSAKHADVELFQQICHQIHEGHHRTAEGFAKIVKAAMRMNSSGKRKYSEDEILGSLRSGEGIVCARGKPREEHEVPTCTNGVTTSPLSQPGTQ